MIDKNLLPLKPRVMKKLSVEDRISAVISDGMWYHFPKWRERACVTEEELAEWIDRALSEKRLIQSDTGAKSYRISKDRVLEWYAEQGLPLDTQLFSKNFPPRIWDGKTEAEGFIECPVREIGVVSYKCLPETALRVKARLRGIARVREVSPGIYKAYGLNADYIKEAVLDEVSKQKVDLENRSVKSYPCSRRRELVDFSDDFVNPLIEFYTNFAKVLVGRSMETISIFLPDEDDRRSQIVLWVISAIEKFDEKSSVPFSGYLDTVLKRWPYNLPVDVLGKDLSSYQRMRKKAIRRIRANKGGDDYVPNSDELASEMDMSTEEFLKFEEKHRAWQMSMNPSGLNWVEDGGEKLIERNLSGNLNYGHKGAFSVDKALKMNVISRALIKAGIETGRYSECSKIIKIIDVDDLDIETALGKIDEDFVDELREVLLVELTTKGISL